MKELLKQEFDIAYPGGRKGTKLKLERVLNSTSIKTSKVEYKLKSSDKNSVKWICRNR